MRSLSVRLFVLIGALSLGVGAFPQPNAATASSMRVAQLEEIDEFRTETWRWQSLMHKPRTPTQLPRAARRRREVSSGGSAISGEPGRARPSARPSTRRTAAPGSASTATSATPRQGWRTHTGNGYYGGLQMDIGFQREYGPELLRRKGTADNWTAVEQMWVAERAHRSGRGFYPWPNTARYCGLI